MDVNWKNTDIGLRAVRANMKTEGDDKLPDHELVAQVSYVFASYCQILNTDIDLV